MKCFVFFSEKFEKLEDDIVPTTTDVNFPSGETLYVLNVFSLNFTIILLFVDSFFKSSAS